MQTNRLFEIIYILLDKKNVPAKELAEHFGTSTRTIYRDIDVLSTSGIPVYTERGRKGGISLLPGFVLNKSLLNEQDQNEILCALQGLSAVKTDETNRVLNKLSTIFNKSATPWLDVDFTDWSLSQESIFHDFKIGIVERRVVLFDYYSAFGEKTSRRAEPIQLWFKSKAWYVKCYCLAKQDVRVFKLTRVRDLQLTDEHFSPRDLPEIMDDEGEPDATIPMKLKIAPAMTHKVFDWFDHPEKQTDGSHIVSANWGEDEWVYGFILSFGEHVEVLEPQHLRAIIKEKAEKIVARNL